MRCCVAVILAATLSGCGAAKQTTILGVTLPAECKRPAHDHVKRRCADWFLNEIAGGRRGAYRDSRLAAYVDRVGQRLARQIRAPHTRWRFIVLDDGERHASTIGAGYVYVTRGALAALRSEAELAALLGHEIAHGLAGHGDDFWHGIDTDRTDRPLRDRYAYERDRERHADELGTTLLVRAGYTPRAMVDMFGRILRFESKPGDDGAYRSHPRARVRVARAYRAIGGKRKGRVGRCDYLRRIDGLVTGHDPRNGQVFGRSYVISSVGLSFDRHPRWTYRQSGRRLEAWNQRRSARAVVLQVSAMRAAAYTASLSGRKTTRIAGYRAELGWMNVGAADSPLRLKGAGKYAARIAVVKTRRRHVVVVLAGRKRAGVSALFGRYFRPRRTTASEHKRVKPTRLATSTLLATANCPR